jgi:hypothetical protein
MLFTDSQFIFPYSIDHTTIMPHFSAFKAGFKLRCIFLLLIAFVSISLAVLSLWLRYATSCVVYDVGSPPSTSLSHRSWKIRRTLVPRRMAVAVKHMNSWLQGRPWLNLAEFGGILNLSIIHTEWGIYMIFRCYDSYCYRVAFHNNDSGSSGKRRSVGWTGSLKPLDWPSTAQLQGT